MLLSIDGSLGVVIRGLAMEVFNVGCCFGVGVLFLLLTADDATFAALAIAALPARTAGRAPLTFDTDGVDSDEQL